MTITEALGFMVIGMLIGFVAHMIVAIYKAKAKYIDSTAKFNQYKENLKNTTSEYDAWLKLCTRPACPRCVVPDCSLRSRTGVAACSRFRTEQAQKTWRRQR